MAVLLTYPAPDAWAREYDPRVGRFLQAEPVLGTRVRHHYAYSNLNPALFMDPSGNTPIGGEQTLLPLNPAPFRSEALFPGSVTPLPDDKTIRIDISIFHQDKGKDGGPITSDLFAHNRFRSMLKTTLGQDISPRVRIFFIPYKGEEPEGLGWFDPSILRISLRDTYMAAGKLASSPVGSWRTGFNRGVFNATVRAQGGDRSWYVANALHHEIGYHHLAGNRSDKAGGKGADASLPWPNKTWGKGPTTFPLVERRAIRKPFEKRLTKE